MIIKIIYLSDVTYGNLFWLCDFVGFTLMDPNWELQIESNKLKVIQIKTFDDGQR